MHISIGWRHTIVGLTLLQWSNAGLVSSPLHQRNVLSSLEERHFYNEEPVIGSRFRTHELLEEISPTDHKAPLNSRQDTTAAPASDPDQGTANTNPADGAGLPPPPQQSQDPAVALNDSTGAANTSDGTTPGHIITAPNPDSDQVNCSEVATGRSNECWVELGLTTYVKQWALDHTCYKGEGFSTCFLRQNHFPGLDCSVITPSSCPAIQSDISAMDPRQWYVAYNIYAINAFFYSWWLAVGNSGAIASNNIGQIIQILNPPKDDRVDIQWALIAFQTLFAFAPGLAGVLAYNQGLQPYVQAAAQVVSNALATAPNLGRFLFPEDSPQGRIVMMADLAANFGMVLQGIQANLNLTLTSVMSNLTEFLAFAEQGNFSAHPQSLPEQADYLYYGFNTYLISHVLAEQGVYGVVGLGTDVHQLATNGTDLAQDVDLKDCKTGYNAQGICDAWWYSASFESSFTLDDFNHMNRNYGPLLDQLLSNLTTGELLFENAYTCNAYPASGSVNVTVDAGGVHTACISQLRMLTWDMNCHRDHADTGLQSDDCEFLEMPKQPAFWNTHMTGYDTPGSKRYGVPYGYLGPGITQSSITIARDN